MYLLVHDKSHTIKQRYMTLLDRFHVLCTLSSEYFSTFPHGTCLLLVSRLYLALDGAYHLLCAAFPNNTTLMYETCINIKITTSLQLSLEL